MPNRFKRVEDANFATFAEIKESSLLSDSLNNFLIQSKKNDMSKKILIPIIVILVIAAGIGVYFILQKPTSEPPEGKCGDGICDAKEKANTNLKTCFRPDKERTGF